MNSTWVDPDLTKSPEQLLAERSKRFADVEVLKQPDRIPIVLPMSYLIAEMGGITKQELHDNPQKTQEILEEAAKYFMADAVWGPVGGPDSIKTLGDTSWKYPGYGLGPNDTFQYVEGEYLKPEEYDDFILDPGDWGTRVYLPRVFTKLQGFKQLRHMALTTSGALGMNLAALTSPEWQETFEALRIAGETAVKSAMSMMDSIQRMIALGQPPVYLQNGWFASAPFDAMSDTLRGMRGVMLDMHKRPDKLLAAIEKMRIIETRDAIENCKALGMKYVGSMLHRGSDGFMSLKQFEKFYWPSLKQLWLDCIDEGLTPFVFYEGNWDQRLEYLADLPKGKTVGWFQSSDIFKVKEVLGDTMCIMGGMPNSMLQSASEEEVEEYTKKVCQVVGKDGGFVMSVTIGEMEGANPKLVKTWIDATKKYGTY